MWNREIETINRKDLEKLQFERLKESLQSAFNAPYYQKLFNEHHITIDSIRTLEHIKDIPFLTKNDLRLSYPDGMVAVSRSEIVRMHASSGTTGKSTVIFYTMNDIIAWADLVARCMVATGATKDDVFQNMMGYGLFTGGLGLHYGAERLGCMVIPAASGNTLRQIQLMQDFGTTIIHITPSYALHLAEEIAAQGINPRDLTVKKAYLG
ncbi:MAG: phenylacetate--CoA ligase, partial [Spirochaetes bacterium]|nr:phenylacetate--CoA ligase [Spirochaetota bacterium]